MTTLSGPACPCMAQFPALIIGAVATRHPSRVKDSGQCCSTTRRSPMKSRTHFLLVAAALAALTTAAPAPTAEPPTQGIKKLTRAEFDDLMTKLSNWGRWGKDDQLGALNLITPEKRRQAAALVQEGISLSMARLAIKEPMDGSPAFVH